MPGPPAVKAEVSHIAWSQGGPNAALLVQSNAGKMDDLTRLCVVSVKSVTRRKSLENRNVNDVFLTENVFSMTAGRNQAGDLTVY